MLLLVGPREPSRPDRWRISWRTGSRVGTFGVCLALTLTTDGAAGAAAAVGALYSAVWAGASLLGDPWGMKQHRQ